MMNNSFVNASKPLVEDFKELCTQLDIQTSKINKYFIKKDKTYGYSISIGSKVEVKRFLQKVNPRKWNDRYRRFYWGITLIYLNAPKYIRNTIQKQIEEDFPNPVDRRFSIEFLKYLYNLCIDVGLEINESSILKAIRNAFKYERNRYSKDLAEDLRVQFIKMGNLKKLKGQDIPIDEKTIKKYLNLLFEEKDYEIYKSKGKNAFEKWYKNNKNIYIDEKGIRRFGKRQRNIICRHIYEIIKNSETNVDTSEIYKKLKFIIDNEDINCNIDEERVKEIDDDSNLSEKDLNFSRVLRLERISYLINHKKYKSILKKLLKKHIEFVKELEFHSHNKVKVYKKDLFFRHDFLGNRNLMMEIINDLESYFDFQFNIFFN